MTQRNIVVIGCSAGSFEGLRILVAGLPSTLPAALLVVTHMPADRRSFLADILNGASALPAIRPLEGDPVIHGRIYLPTVDRHLLVKNSRIKLTSGPKEKFSRPSIDTLFRSAALCYGSRVIGILLSGALDDGTARLEIIKDHGY
ncbi:chemotaxis protein CheB [Glaciimonas sp. PCH181]|uniref:chemotaxis protein CheB n=1 Tax=Glaciimonas sp. PCH181 TaxID=2133943 RepID=UPI001374CD40